MQAWQPDLWLLGPGGACAQKGFSSSRGQQSLQPGEVVGGHGKGEAGAYPLEAAIDGLGHAADGLGPAESLFDPVAVFDRQGVSLVPVWFWRRLLNISISVRHAG